MLKKVEIKQSINGEMTYTQNSKLDHHEKLKMSFDLPATIKSGGVHTHKPSTIDEDGTILSSKENTLPHRSDTNEGDSLSHRIGGT
jgi:hypothetical protein